jgi:hypothetical protein
MPYGVLIVLLYLYDEVLTTPILPARHGRLTQIQSFFQLIVAAPFVPPFALTARRIPPVSILL